MESVGENGRDGIEDVNGQTQVLGEQGLTLELSEGGRKLRACYTPVQGAAAVDLPAIKKAISAQGFGKLSIFDAALQTLAAHCGKAQEFTIDIGEVRDCEARIDIAPDLMAATLTATRAQGGKPLGRDMVAKLLADKKITHGILHDDIGRAIAEGEANALLIAKGRKPVNGEDGKLKSLIEMSKERRPRFDSNDVANYRELGGIVVVYEGQELMQCIPPTQGEAGINIQGKEIPGKSGKAVKFSAQLKGTKLDPNDPNLLVAAIAGQPVLAEGGMIVEPSITVGTVDLNSGNLDFDGSIVIKGDVQPGMAIYASGDIQVGGTVEAATLDAKGDVVVKGGIIGHNDAQDSARARVRCGGTCSALFIENASIEAGNSIQIERHARQSDLAAANQVIVGRPGSKQGNIIGGSVRATMLVQAGTIGTPVGVKTHIMVGSNPKLDERMKVLNRELEQKAKELDDVVKIITFLTENPARAKPGMQQKAENSRDRIMQEMESVRMERDDAAQALKLADGARFVVEKILYTNVKIEIGDKVKQEEVEREAGIYVLKEGEIQRI